MKKKHISDAVLEGYFIDDEVYPPLAYKGPRLRPTEHADCWTESESLLYRALALVVAEAPTHLRQDPVVSEAFALLREMSV